MASNFFGQIFRMTTFGESRGPAVGVVIDGCPAGVPLRKEDIEAALFRRRPGVRPYTSSRKEPDEVEILSGLYSHQTTGSPIALIIRNKDLAEEDPLVKDCYRPGHASFSYLKKYGVFDPSGGGRASGRETAARVAAGAVARQFLSERGISCVAFLSDLGAISMPTTSLQPLSSLRENVDQSPVFCPNALFSAKMEKLLQQVIEEQDSVGGAVFCVSSLPEGLGDPVYGKLPALLSFAMLSIPACRGVSFGHGFDAVRMRGSQHNDSFYINETGAIRLETNHSGGTLGGITTGLPLLFRAAFKPTSSIGRPQKTFRFDLSPETLSFSRRHDPCLAIRAVPVVEAMASLVFADALLLNRCAKA